MVVFFLELYPDFRRDTYEEMIHLLRDENDSALRANDALRRDLREMHNAIGEVKNMYERDLDRQRSENTRFKNQVQMQQRKLLSLWKAFCAVKREVGLLLVPHLFVALFQARELQTTASLGVERQKAEFVRCATMLLGHIKNLEDRVIYALLYIFFYEILESPRQLSY